MDKEMKSMKRLENKQREKNIDALCAGTYNLVKK